MSSDKPLKPHRSKNKGSPEKSLSAYVEEIALLLRKQTRSSEEAAKKIKAKAHTSTSKTSLTNTIEQVAKILRLEASKVEKNHSFSKKKKKNAK